jgi:hypothetical protein
MSCCCFSLALRPDEFDLQALPDRFDLRLLGISQIQLLPDSSMMMVVPIIMMVDALSEDVASDGASE